MIRSIAILALSFCFLSTSFKDNDHIEIYLNGNLIAGPIYVFEAVQLDTINVGDTILIKAHTNWGGLDTSELKVRLYTQESRVVSTIRNRKSIAHEAEYRFIVKSTNRHLGYKFDLNFNRYYSKEPWHFASIKLTNAGEMIRYKVQLGAYSREIPKSQASLMLECGEDIHKGKMTNDRIIRYYSGTFKSLDDAKKHTLKMKNHGFQDAFVVGFFMEDKIPINEALLLQSK